MRTTILFQLTFVGVLSCYAQVKAYTSQSEKAVKHLEKALSFYESKNDEKALPELEEALKADSTFVEAHMLLANIYSDMREPEKAIHYYKKAIDFKPDFFPKNYLFLARLEMAKEAYNDAKTHLTKFLAYSPSAASKVTQQNLSDGRKLMEQCEFALNAVNNPVPFKPVALSDSINTGDGEYFPTLTADEQTLYFTKLNLKKKEEDVFVSHKINGRWMPALPIGAPINTDDNEGALCISPDGKYLFFTACGRKDGMGDCDLYMSEKVGDHWSNPVNMGEPVNTRFWESQPSFSSDGKTLYFVSNRTGGLGGSDIYKTTRKEDGTWSEPVNLGSKINTAKAEFSPYMHPDNKTLYYTSAGKLGMGGLDIYVSKLQPDGEWEEAKNLGYPINTAADERSFTVSANGKLAYISSDRLNGKGNQDLYTFNLYKEVQPEAVTYLKGIVSDKNTRQKLNAKFELIDIVTGKTIVESFSDKISGEFLVCVPGGHEYVLNVSRQGYLFYSDNIMVKDMGNLHEPFLADVTMSPVKAGESVVLKNIFFDSNSFELKSESNVEMQKLAAFLKANGNVSIEVSGHTDNTGDKLKNKALSEKRAKAVYDNLVSFGIPAARLTFKGYGETKPIASNATEEGKAQNRRTEFMVLPAK